MSIKSLFSGVILAACVSACAINAPVYTSSIDSVSQLKKLPAPVGLGAFTAEKPELQSIQLRADHMVAPQGSFSEYLKAAVTSDLQMASKLGGPSDAQLSAALVTNDLDTSSGTGKIAARFRVTRGNTQTYDKLLTADSKFETSLIAAIAIPNAVNSYKGLVEQFLMKLYSDEDFSKAVK